DLALFPKLGGEDVRGHVHGFDPGGARAAGVDEDHPVGGGKSVLLELDVDRPCARIVVVDGHGDRTAREILPARVPLDRLLVVFLETRHGGGGGRPLRLLKHRCGQGAGGEREEHASEDHGKERARGGCARFGHGSHPTCRSWMKSSSSARSGAIVVNSANRSLVWVIA